mmetsp:Transcript_30174/g.83253  ORF Transcript_30174/g.83253 Transcript_30174/m.83253 type:complete len:261 (+) Transcript_30174:607-1389(+)
METPASAAHDEVDLALRPATLGQQRHERPAMDVEAALGERALQAHQARASDIADVQANVVDEGDPLADAEADRTQVDGAADDHLIAPARSNLRHYPTGGQCCKRHQVLAMASSVYCLPRHGREAHRLPRPQACRQSPHYERLRGFAFGPGLWNTHALDHTPDDHHGRVAIQEVTPRLGAPRHEVRWVQPQHVCGRPLKGLLAHLQRQGVDVAAHRMDLERVDVARAPHDVQLPHVHGHPLVRMRGLLHRGRRLPVCTPVD